MTETLGAVMTKIDVQRSMMREWERENYAKIKADIAKVHVHSDRWLASSKSNANSHEAALASRQRYDARMVQLLLSLKVHMPQTSYFAEPKRPYKDPVREAD